jgi:hypothetical protein
VPVPWMTFYHFTHARSTLGLRPFRSIPTNPLPPSSLAHSPSMFNKVSSKLQNKLNDLNLGSSSGGQQAHFSSLPVLGYDKASVYRHRLWRGVNLGELLGRGEGDARSGHCRRRKPSEAAISGA